MLLNNNRDMVETPFYSVYVVVNGDTLYKISKDFNVNPKLVAELNGLKLDEYIYPKQVLLIPKKGVQFYITKDDDTLRDVSKIFNVSETNIIKQNKSIYLLPGQMIFYKDEPSN